LAHAAPCHPLSDRNKWPSRASVDPLEDALAEVPSFVSGGKRGRQLVERDERLLLADPIEIVDEAVIQSCPTGLHYRPDIDTVKRRRAIDSRRLAEKSERLAPARTALGSVVDTGQTNKSV
jgi:hypothetical protein